MQNNDCVFCKIIAGGLPATKVWENNKFIAILNLFPNTKGATVVVSKEHLPSEVFKNNDETLTDAMLAAKIVGEKLKKSLQADRVCLVGEGLAVEHFHLKLYPVFNFKEYMEKSKDLPVETEYFEDYKGYLSTKPGPMADRKVLDELGDLIKSA